MSADTERFEDLPDEPEDFEEQDDTKADLRAPKENDGDAEPTVLEGEEAPEATTFVEEQDPYEPSPRGQSLRRSADPSLEEPLEVTDLVNEDPISYDEDAASRRARARKEDDVFVILPEQVEGEIPVVDTEKFDGPTEDMDVPLLRELPRGDTELVDGEPTETVVGETELVSDEDLDQLATDVGDDDMLATDVGDEFSEEGFDDFSGGIDEMEEVEEVAPGGSVLKWFVAVAAMGLIGVGAYTYYVNPELFAPLVAWGSGSQTSAVNATGGPPLEGATNVEGPDTGNAEVNVGTAAVSASGGDGSPATETARLRREFREKLVLALRLGFKGEEVDE